jgi:hypothetical protein
MFRIIFHGKNYFQVRDFRQRQPAFHPLPRMLLDRRLRFEVMLKHRVARCFILNPIPITLVYFGRYGIKNFEIFYDHFW